MVCLPVRQQKPDSPESVSSMAVIILVRQGDDGCAIPHSDRDI